MKITFTILSLFIAVFISNSQTFTTGTVVLSTTLGLEYSAKIDITATEVTLTLIGPSDRYFGLGFGVQTMTANGNANRDVVMYLGGTNLSDRTFIGFSTPTLDTNQDWTTDSNIINGGVRTIISTRALNTGEVNDYVFSTSDTSIDLVWSRGSTASFALEYHGSTNRGVTSSTLRNESFELDSNFKIFPNPSSLNLNIELPNNITNAKVEVYDILGKQIYNKEITKTPIDIRDWSRGIYLVRVSTSEATHTKRFIKQ